MFEKKTCKYRKMDEVELQEEDGFLRLFL